MSTYVLNGTPIQIEMNDDIALAYNRTVDVCTQESGDIIFPYICDDLYAHTKVVNYIVSLIFLNQGNPIYDTLDINFQHLIKV